MMKPLVIYHGACRDGFCAAWVVHKRYPEADFFEGFYGDKNLPNVAGRDVIMVDFSYKRPVLKQLAAECKSMIILDHHKTAKEDLEGFQEEFPNVKVFFDMDRSGAGLAWDYYFTSQPRTWVVDYIEDRDLWRFQLPESKVVNAALSVVPFDFHEWDKVEMLDQTTAIEMGSAVQAKTDQYVREVAKNSRLIHFEGHAVPCVNAPQVDISELLDRLATQEPAPPFAMGWFQVSNGLFKFSLRSRGDFDVSAIAKKYGGGGHKNAAGFESPGLEVIGATP